MKKVALYARVSTFDQDPTMQLLALRNYALKRGFVIYREYVDHLSGRDESRFEYQRLFEDVRKRRVDVVMVWKFDRFARSTKSLLSTLEEFNLLGVDFISYQENIDTTSSLGKMIFILIGAFAEFERDIIVSRVKAGLEKAKLQGKILGRPSLGKDLVEKILNHRQAGLSVRKISRQEKNSVGAVAKYLQQK